MSSGTPTEMPEVEVPNLRVADAASQFREAAELLLHQLLQHNCVLPLLMVGGFAIELYLKSLNSRNVYHDLFSELGIAGGYRVTPEPIQRVHSLVQLFDGLEATIQEALQRAYASRPAVQAVATIREALCRYDGIFIKARYPFEDGASIGDGSINSLVHLAGIIGDYVGSLHARLREDVSGNRAK